MNIPKAIEIKTKDHRDNIWEEGSEMEQADLLSLEALKVIIKVRPSGYWDIDYPLPGETKE